MTPVLAVGAIIVTIVLARVLRHANDRLLIIALTLLLGGALGNLADRIFRAPGFLRGHVVDFVAVGWWPVFNVADSCVTIGAILLIVCSLRTPAASEAVAVAARSAPVVVSEPIPVPGPLEGVRIDRAVALLTGWSRADVQDLLARDAIVVDGRPVGKSHRLVEGTVIELLDEPTTGAPPAADATIEVDVRYADDDVIVVAKPAGLVVHPGAGHAGGTLVNGLLARYPEIATVGDEMRPGIVHRLDRDTSGLLVAARSARAYDSLVRQIAARTVDRRYVALVWGVMDSPRGIVDAPIGRSTARRTRMAVRESGKAARTAYEVRTVFAEPVCSLLDCRLETGRTHQIRVHLERDRTPDRRRRDLRRRARRDPARPPVPARVRSWRSTSPPPASGSRSPTRCRPSLPPCSPISPPGPELPTPRIAIKWQKVWSGAASCHQSRGAGTMDRCVRSSST